MRDGLNFDILDQSFSPTSNSKINKQGQSEQVFHFSEQNWVGFPTGSSPQTPCLPFDSLGEGALMLQNDCLKEPLSRWLQIACLC